MTLDETLAALHPTQRAAVTHPARPLLLACGPGSGKTRILTHRIQWLVQHEGLDADRHPGPHVLAGRRGRAARAARPGPRPAGARAVGRHVPRVRRLAPAPACRHAGPNGRLHDPRPRGHAPADRAARGGARPRGRPRDPGRGRRAGEGPARAGGGPCGGVPLRSARRAPGRLRDAVPGGERVRLHGPAGCAARPLPPGPRGPRGAAHALPRASWSTRPRTSARSSTRSSRPSRRRTAPSPSPGTTTRRSTGGGAAT